MTPVQKQAHRSLVVGKVTSRTPLTQAWSTAEQVLVLHRRLSSGLTRATHSGRGYPERALDSVRLAHHVEDLAALLHRSGARTGTRAAASARIEAALADPLASPDRLFTAALGRRLTDAEHRKAAPHLYCRDCAKPLTGAENPPGVCPPQQTG
ncbi:MAG: hypothetical protein M3Y35_18015 [Actinomycetota bacterium]|nr:hypothetical protein [Actinomycetota bacterium]